MFTNRTRLRVLITLAALWVGGLLPAGCNTSARPPGGSQASELAQGVQDSGSSPGTGDGTAPSNNEPLPGLTDGLTSLDYTADQLVSASTMVSASAGGTVSVPGDGAVRVEFSAGAFAVDTQVTATLVRGPADDLYALGIVVESDAADLPDSAVVVIPLDPPLDDDVSLHVVDLPTGDPADSADTNILAEISSDRTEARIPLNAFATGSAGTTRDDQGTKKKGAGTRINCHFGTMRDVFEGLGKDPATIRREVEQANGNRLTPAEYDTLESNLTAIQAGQPCFPNDRQIGAFVGTYYTEEPVSSQITGDKDASGNLLPVSLTATCKTNLSSAASGKLPVVMFQGSKLVKDSRGFYQSISHSARITQQNGQPVILNDLSLNAKQRARLEAARRARGLDPNAPLMVPFDQLTGEQRTQRTGELLEREIRDLEGNDDYNFVGTPVERRPQNLGDVVIFTPKTPGGTTQQPFVSMCMANDVLPPEPPPAPEPMFQVFRITNYSSIADGYLTVLDSTAPADPPLLSSYPGGGIDPEQRADLTPFTPDEFATPEEAAASICSGFERFWRPPLASFILAADWNGQQFGVDGIFQSQCPVE